jgi:hypothetical protein
MMRALRKSYSTFLHLPDAAAQYRFLAALFNHVSGVKV